MSKLTEKTWVPLGVAIVAIGGGAAWLAYVQFQIDAHGNMIEKTEAKQEQLAKDIGEIKNMISNIEGYLTGKGRKK